jgi:hypothetical protein
MVFLLLGATFLFIYSDPLVGPSSSHTVGPMRAGKIFIQDLEQLNLLEKVCRMKITLCVVFFPPPP